MFCQSWSSPPSCWLRRTANCTIEAPCDFVEARHNEKIKLIRNIAAAAVGVSIIVWLVVLAVEISRFWPWQLRSG
jgi:diacylglycerol kinase (ATP)